MDGSSLTSESWLISDSEWFLVQITVVWVTWLWQHVICVSWSFHSDRIHQTLLRLISLSSGCKSEKMLSNSTYIGYAWQAVHCILCQNLNSAMDRHLSTANKIFPVHTMVTNRGSRIIALFILNVNSSCRWVVRLCLGFCNPREKISDICWVGAGEQLCQSGHLGEEKNLLPCQELDCILSSACSLISKQTELSLNTSMIWKTK